MRGSLGFSWGLVHDVKVGGIETKGGGWETISDQVDPEKLDGDEGLWHAEGGGQEDTDDLADVG